MPQLRFRSGDDVTTLMGGINSGDDVTDLMNLSSGTDVTSLMGDVPGEDEEEEKGILGKTWDLITPPVIKAPGEFLRGIATSIDKPKLDRSPIEAALRGSVAGMIGGMPGEEEIPFIGGRGGLAGEVDIALSPIGLAGLAAKPVVRGVIGAKAGISRIRGRARPTVLKDTPEIKVIETPSDKLRTALDESKPLNERQKEIYAKGIREKLAEKQPKE